MPPKSVSKPPGQFGFNQFSGQFASPKYSRYALFKKKGPYLYKLLVMQGYFQQVTTAETKWTPANNLRDIHKQQDSPSTRPSGPYKASTGHTDPCPA